MRRPKNWRRKEKWKPVRDFPLFQVSNMGRVKRFYPMDGRWRKKGWKQVELKLMKDRQVARVNMWNEKGKAQRYLTQLVGDHWLKPRHPGLQVRYRDKTDPLDCSVGNLKEHGFKRYKTQKLLPKERDYIRKRLKEDSYRGLGRELADMFDITPAAISYIKQQDDKNSYR